MPFARALLFSVLLCIAVGAQGAGRTQYLVKFRGGVEALSATELLGKSGLKVRRVFPELSMYVAAPEKPGQDPAAALAETGQVEYVERDERIWHAIHVPNDPDYPSQQAAWGQVNAEQAWDSATGSSGILVAVVDTGGTPDHPDLKGNVVAGWNFIQNGPDARDDHGHATHVAGIIGGIGDNGIGVAGMSWNVSIMPLKFLDSGGSGQTSDGVAAILYAVKHGAKIINASWGGKKPSNALRDAIDYAFGHGTLLIAAAGNDRSNTDSKPQYPSAYDVPGVLAVAATRDGSGLASFSNFGPTSVHVAAPGNGIVSTFPPDGYKRMSGTSMATPVVSGIAALLLSKAQLSALELRNALLNAVKPRRALEGKVASEGEINAELALANLSAGFQVWPGHLLLKKGARFRFSAYQPTGAVTWSVSDPGVASISVDGELTALKGGEVQVSAIDASGATASTRPIVVIEPSGGGCRAFGTRESGPSKPVETAASAFGLGLPLVVAFVMRRRD